ncbi:hypothetical protein [Marinobacter sp.]|uniref:hypothetical protein n=1 Tax=Marinobacter sp. TaxID=50741 RepID=UPI003A90B403
MPDELSAFGDREMLHLWYLLGFNNHNLDQSYLGSQASFRNEYLADFITRESFTGNLTNMKSTIVQQSLNESHFEWIDSGDKRLLSWLVHVLSSEKLQVPIVGEPYRSALQGKELIVLSFDAATIIFFGVQGKKEVMDNLRRRWCEITEVDPLLKWVSSRNDDQCRWLIEKMGRSTFSWRFTPQSEALISSEDRYLFFLKNLDSSGLGLDVKRLFINDLKRKWKRKVSGNRKSKVQCNLVVNPETKTAIKEMAKKQRVTMGQVIDGLISQESTR